MIDFSDQINDINYGDWVERNKDALLKSAVKAIYPDKMKMTRANALTLAGAMKNCGFTREEFAEVMARSSVDKGTFAAQWGSFTGEGKNGIATEGTVFEYAKQCGWHWPDPESFGDKGNESPRKHKPKDDAFTVDISDDFTFICLIDSVGYKQKPVKPGEIRLREKVPTPAPERMSITDFASAISDGRTFYPTVYSKEQLGFQDDGRAKYQYRPISQQIFVVDIDNEEAVLDETGKPIIEDGKQKKRRIADPLTVDSAKEICKRNGIAPFMIYETFSSKFHREDAFEPYIKFRICFVLDEPLTVQEVGTRGIDSTIRYFIGLFGSGADKSTTDPARLIYGTDESDRITLFNKAIRKKQLISKILKPSFEVVNGVAVNNSAVTITPAKGKGTDEPVPDFEEFDSDFFNNTEITPPEPIIDQILYPGLAMLGAPAKMGKSYMLLQLCFSIADGKKFLDFDVKRPGSVLYLDLQGSKARTKQRMKAMGYANMPAGVTMVYKAQKTDTGLFEQIDRWLAKQKNPVLIIVDMMEQVKGSQRKAEDAYRADNRILEPLHDISLKSDISIMVSMHTRKGNKILPDDDPFNEIIGSIAQFGTADCAWMIIGKRNKDVKRFSTICRDNVDGQQDYEVNFTNHKWSMAGPVEECAEKRAFEEYKRNPVVFTIKKLIDESGGAWYGTMSDLRREVLSRKSTYPASSPEKMYQILNALSFELNENDGISYESISKGGKSGRRYRFYRDEPEQTQF